MEFTEKHSLIIIPFFLCLLCGLSASNSVDLTEEQDLPTPRLHLTLSQQLQHRPDFIGSPKPLDSVKLRPAHYFAHRLSQPEQIHVYPPEPRITTSK